MALDIDISHYNTGTATVAANGTVVTGQGTTWTVLRKGDMFGTHVGDGVRILSVDSNTQLTLAHPWPGVAQTAAAYEIQRTPHDIGYLEAIETLLRRWGNGIVDALAALDGTGGNKGLMLSGPNTVAAYALTAFSRGLLAQGSGPDFYASLGTIPAAQVGTSLPADSAFRRGNVLGAVSSTSGVPTGAFIDYDTDTGRTSRRTLDGDLECTYLTEITGLSIAPGAVAVVQTGGFLTPFASPPFVSFSGYVTDPVGNRLSISITDGTPGGGVDPTTSYQAVIHNTSSATVTRIVNFHMFAKGRWA